MPKWSEEKKLSMRLFRIIKDTLYMEDLRVIKNICLVLFIALLIHTDNTGRVEDLIIRLVDKLSHQTGIRLYKWTPIGYLDKTT